MPSSARTISRLIIALAVTVVIAGSALATFFISTAIGHGETSCINNNLGDRNGIQAADTRAHVAFALAISRADTKAERIKAGDTYARALVANQKQRDQHPLGKCN